MKRISLFIVLRISGHKVRDFITRKFMPDYYKRSVDSLSRYLLQNGLVTHRAAQSLGGDIDIEMLIDIEHKKLSAKIREAILEMK